MPPPPVHPLCPALHLHPPHARDPQSIADRERIAAAATMAAAASSAMRGSGGSGGGRGGEGTGGGLPTTFVSSDGHA